MGLGPAWSVDAFGARLRERSLERSRPRAIVLPGATGIFPFPSSCNAPISKRKRRARPEFGAVSPTDGRIAPRRGLAASTLVHPAEKSNQGGYDMRTRFIVVFVIVGALGAAVAYQSLIAPRESVVARVAGSATEATSIVAPFEATAMSAAGRDGETTLPTVTADSSVSQRRAIAPTPRP